MESQEQWIWLGEVQIICLRSQWIIKEGARTGIQDFPVLLVMLLIPLTLWFGSSECSVLLSVLTNLSVTRAWHLLIQKGTFSKNHLQGRWPSPPVQHSGTNNHNLMVPRKSGYQFDSCIPCLVMPSLQMLIIQPLFPGNKTLTQA